MSKGFGTPNGIEKDTSEFTSTLRGKDEDANKDGKNWMHHQNVRHFFPGNKRPRTYN